MSNPIASLQTIASDLVGQLQTITLPLRRLIEAGTMINVVFGFVMSAHAHLLTLALPPHFV